MPENHATDPDPAAASSTQAGGDVARRALRRLKRDAGALVPASRSRQEELEAELAAARSEVAALTRKVASRDERIAEQRSALSSFAYAYRGLRAAQQHVLPSALGKPQGSAPSDEQRAEAEREALMVQHHAALGRALADGATLPGAVAAQVRNGKGQDRVAATRRVAQALVEHAAPGSEAAIAGALGVGLLAHHTGVPGFAWEQLRSLPDDVWIAHAPAEYLELVGSEEPARIPAAVDAVLAADADLDPQVWLQLVRLAVGLQAHERLADLDAGLRAAVAREQAVGRTTPEADQRWAAELAWLDHWLPRVTGTPATPTLPEGAVAIGVMGYQQPDLSRTSTNIGDFVQTIGSLSHLARRTGVRYADGPLAPFLRELAGRVPEDLRVPAAPGGDGADGGEGPEVHLFGIDRDASSLAEIPDGTWMLGFGWYAHTVGGVRHDFPFDARIRPLYVSFHVNRRTILSPEAIEHLRAHGPIGCRDWSTVDLLLSLDVPAFFSGCLTTTVRFVKPSDLPTPGPDAPVVYVDAEPPAGATKVLNERPEVALAGLEANLREALDILDGYATGAASIVTKRLHAYLPARALGRPVDFCPSNLADTRFNGLAHVDGTRPAALDDDEVHAMGQGIADLLEPVLTAILAGDDEAAVRAAWSEVTAERVAQAQARRDAQVELPLPFDLDAAVATVLSRRVRVEPTAAAPAGEPMDVVLALDGNLRTQLAAVVSGVVDHASRPVVLHVLSRDHGPDDHARLAAQFPEVSWDWLPCDDVDYGDIGTMLRHVTISTMDRLLLPVLLPEVERVVYHDIDALPLADLAPLLDLDLGGQPLAARDSEASLFASGHENVYQSVKRLREAPTKAFELLRRELARHPGDFTGFNAGVLVLDLERMRDDDFCRRFLPYASEFGMHDQYVLNCYVGARRVSLAPEWNARPSQESVAGPRIVHWAGGQKPWDPGFVPFRDAWQRAVERAAARAR